MKYLDYFKLTGRCSWLAIAMKSRRRDAKRLKRASNRGIEQQYLAFDAIIANYQAKPALTRFKRVGAMLVDYYNNAPKGLGAFLYERRRNHRLDECPYCGNPGSPDTLDHFVPKDHWPEYSIFPNNLVPQCRDCAPIKGNRYYCDQHMRAMFLHPMYSDVLSRVRFRIDVQLQDKEPQFLPKFSVDQTVTPADIERLKTHMSELNLKSRIVLYCHRQYSHWKRKLGEHKFDVRESFSIRLREQKDKEYARDWGTAFFQGMLRNQEAVENLQKFASQSLPSHPEPEVQVDVLL